jgi:hypothetical protein
LEIGLRDKQQGKERMEDSYPYPLILLDEDPLVRDISCKEEFEIEGIENEGEGIRHFP